MHKLFLILILLTIGCSNRVKKELKIEPPKRQLKIHLGEFVESEWSKVFKAKDSLMIFGKEVIPHLIDLMKDEKRFVKLSNTADLIYPGATEYWGHGRNINYDLDWISIRAGWALEDLTFQNFGFIENSITNVDLIQLHKDNYEEYIKTENNDVNFERESFKKLSSSINKATEWWIQNEEDWTNLKAIKEALFSDDVKRQFNVISHLRYPNYESKGLTIKFYEEVLELRIKELTNSKDESVAHQAKLKLEDRK